MKAVDAPDISRLIRWVTKFRHIIFLQSFGESHGSAIGCVVDGVHATKAERSRYSALSGQAQTRAKPVCNRAEKLIRSRYCQALLRA